MLDDHAGARHWDLRQQSAAALRANVVLTASQLLVSEGPEALTVRRLAEKLGCSTKVLYTNFKGKYGIASALYQQGCASLHVLLASISGQGGPSDYLQRLAAVYWDFSLNSSGYYRVMFCGAIPGFNPKNEDIQAAATAFNSVLYQLEAYLHAELLPAADAQILFKSIWAGLHGVISLNLLNHFDNQDQALAVYRQTTSALLYGVMPEATWH